MKTGEQRWGIGRMFLCILLLIGIIINAFMALSKIADTNLFAKETESESDVSGEIEEESGHQYIGTKEKRSEDRAKLLFEEVCSFPRDTVRIRISKDNIKEKIAECEKMSAESTKSVYLVGENEGIKLTEIDRYDFHKLILALGSNKNLFISGLAYSKEDAGATRAEIYQKSVPPPSRGKLTDFKNLGFKNGSHELVSDVLFMFKIPNLTDLTLFETPIWDLDFLGLDEYNYLETINIIDPPNLRKIDLDILSNLKNIKKIAITNGIRENIDIQMERLLDLLANPDLAIIIDLADLKAILRMCRKRSLKLKVNLDYLGIHISQYRDLQRFMNVLHLYKDVIEPDELSHIEVYLYRDSKVDITQQKFDIREFFEKLNLSSRPYLEEEYEEVDNYLKYKLDYVSESPKSPKK